MGGSVEVEYRSLDPQIINPRRFEFHPAQHTEDISTHNLGYTHNFRVDTSSGFNASSIWYGGLW